MLTEKEKEIQSLKARLGEAVSSVFDGASAPSLEDGDHTPPLIALRG